MIKLNDLFFDLIHGNKLKYILDVCFPQYLKIILLNRHLEKLSNFPQTVTIELTNNCNAKCEYCARQNYGRKLGYMSYQLLKKIGDEVSFYKLKSLSIAADGEPTLHPDIIKYLRYLSPNPAS